MYDFISDRTVFSYDGFPSVFTWAVAAEEVADEVGAGDATLFAVEFFAEAFLEVGRLGGEE